MIIQIILTLCCLAIVFYGFGQYHNVRLASYMMILSGPAAIFFIWQPDEATRIANLLGVGRGADLLLYFWVVISAAVMLVFHGRLRQQELMITKLARHIALSDVPRSGQNS